MDSVTLGEEKNPSGIVLVYCDFIGLYSAFGAEDSRWFFKYNVEAWLLIQHLHINTALRVRVGNNLLYKTKISSRGKYTCVLFFSLIFLLIFKHPVCTDSCRPCKRMQHFSDLGKRQSSASKLIPQLTHARSWLSFCVGRDHSNFSSPLDGHFSHQCYLLLFSR